MMRFGVIGFVWIALFCSAAQAIEPDEILADPALEQRARSISSGLRCLVCQNQSIDDSDAPLARDLRLLVRERLKNGDTDAQATNFIVARYGDFVLLRPPLSLSTAVLWFTPALLFLFGVYFIYRSSRKPVSHEIGSKPLSEDEQMRLRKIIGN